MNADVLWMQTALKRDGFYSGALDGIAGPLTFKAIRARLSRDETGPGVETDELPWIAEGLKTLGWHEVADNAKLSAWLKSGGKYLGNPSALPWCGDWAETCIEKALPDEPWPGPVGTNPFFAQNWSSFGVATAPTRGAAVAFRWSASAGHVGFLIGQSGANYVILGGNQGNRVSIAEFPKSAAIATRWPATFPSKRIYLPSITASGATADLASTR